MAWCIRFIVAALIFPWLVAAPSWAVAGQRGTTPSFQIVGSLPENTAVKADLARAFVGSFFPLPPPAGLACPVPRMVVSDIPKVVETDQPAAKLQEIALSSAINGRLLESKEEERYRLPVQPGMKLRFDFLAERAGSPVDGVLILRNEAAQLARSDDQPGSLDPASITPFQPALMCRGWFVDTQHKARTRNMHRPAVLCRRYAWQWCSRPR